MKRFLFAVLALVVLAGCGTEPERPGNPDTYARLAASTSCADLQTELDDFLRVFEAAEPGSERAAVAVAYARAAEERRQALGCEGGMS